MKQRFYKCEFESKATIKHLKEKAARTDLKNLKKSHGDIFQTKRLRKIPDPSSSYTEVSQRLSHSKLSCLNSRIKMNACKDILQYF